jgi:hypothetical protein
MARSKKALATLAALAALATGASAQGTSDATDLSRWVIQRPGVEKGAPPARPAPPPAEQRTLVDAGGWLATSLLTFSLLDHSTSTKDPIDSLFVLDTRLWAQWIRGVRERYYLRARKITLGFDKAPGAIIQETRDLESIDLDLGFAEFPIGKLDARVGRQFVRAGRGIALSQVLDGAHLGYAFGPDAYEVFAAKTTPRTQSLDTSVAGFDRGVEDRIFWGVQYSRLNVGGSRMYAYVFGQNDNSETLSAAQRAFDFGLDSRYAGVGGEGRISDWGRYFLEYVHEFGDTFADTPTPARLDLNADAFDGAIYWFLKNKQRTVVELEYARGSGDAGRTSVTSKFGGRSVAGSGDSVFTGFGRFEGGLALSPLLSNIQILRLGVETKPWLGELTPPADLQVGLHLREYWKDEAAGAISDTAATVASSHLGFGLDVDVSWRASSDLTILAIYGLFDPGSAFPAGTDSASERALLTATLSF